MHTVQPFISMSMELFARKLSHGRVHGTDYAVYMQGSWLTITYASDIFTNHVYGGLSEDRMIAL